MQIRAINERIEMFLRYKLDQLGRRTIVADFKQTRGIRGATTAEHNTPEDILSETSKLLAKIVEDNTLEIKDIAAVFFSATPDLNSAFPAKAARDMGWLSTALFCHVEIDVPKSLKKCIRILMLVNTTLEQHQINHIYLKETTRLRE